MDFKNYMLVFRSVSIWAAIQIFCLQAFAQGNDVEFKIMKLKSAILYPDSVCVLKKGDTLQIKVRGELTTADVEGVDFNKGTVSFSDSLITIIVTQTSTRPLALYPSGADTAAPGDYLDSAIIRVRLKPGAHPADTILAKIIYLVEENPSANTFRKSGFIIRWNKTEVSTLGYKFRRRARTIHHLTKEKLLEDMAYAFKYQNYNAKDTSLNCFDSLYAVVTVQKKNYRFHLAGSVVSPDILDSIRMMHMGDRMRVKLYYTAENNALRRENIYIRVSLFNFNGEVTI